VILLISYDLNDHARPEAYELVRQMIEKHALGFRRPLYSQWFVETSELPMTWSERLRELANANDNWFVVRVQPPYQGWLERSMWKWLSDRI
jgi:hypothetical protein